MCCAGPKVNNPEKINNFKTSSIDETEKPFGRDICFVILKLGKHALYMYKFIGQNFAVNSAMTDLLLPSYPVIARFLINLNCVLRLVQHDV
jgi:hypothetical protein